MADWQIEPLHSSHERRQFCCGKAALDHFLHALVTQYEKRKLGRTYVVVERGQRRILGYYTLASSAIPCHDLPAALAKKLPRHAVPVALLGRLAVDQGAKGQGLGRELLRDALNRCLELSASLGIFAVEVVAIDAEAKAFYQKFGFVPLVDDELHLFLPIKTIQEGLGAKS